MERKPVIVIGMPCYDTVAPEVLEDFGRFMFHLGRRMPNYDFFTAIVTKSEQFRARNAIVDAAIQVNADYLLMIDDDMIINPLLTAGDQGVGSPQEYSLVERLLAHDVDIVGALYYQRTNGCAPVAMTAVPESRGYRFLRDDEITGGLQEVEVTGGGCMLIKMRVFDRLPQPYFAPEFEYGTDIQLCRAAKDKGFKIYLDSSIELGHLRSERVIVTSRNRHMQLDATLPGETKRQFLSGDIYTRLFEDAREWTGYKDIETMAVEGQRFMARAGREHGFVPDINWYRSYPKERIARQVCYNNTHTKRRMTEYILGSIDNRLPARILDYGCGIGIPAFTLAEKGHKVTAIDIDGTSTIQFLKWRAEKNKLSINFRLIDPGLITAFDPGTEFDVIVVMDCLEHIRNWRAQLAELAKVLRNGGVLYANNAALDDMSHPEHYDCRPGEFVAECVKLGLMPHSQLAYIKISEFDRQRQNREEPTVAV